MWKSAISTGVGFSDKAVWSRASRRHASESRGTGEDEDMDFGFKVKVDKGELERTGVKVTIRWLKGHDTVIFESFCGMLKRKLEDLPR